jgi:hypothetical protein
MRVKATGAVNSGVVNATTSFDIGGTPFAFGAYLGGNVFLGFAGNSAMTGGGNTASGGGALSSNTTGGNNTAKVWKKLSLRSLSAWWVRASRQPN